MKPQQTPGTGSSTSTSPVTAGQPLLEVRGLTVSFATRGGAFVAVEGADFDVAAGEVLAVVGESGSGKSVAMLAIMGLLRWTATVTAERPSWAPTFAASPPRRGVRWWDVIWP